MLSINNIIEISISFTNFYSILPFSGQKIPYFWQIWLIYNPQNTGNTAAKIPVFGIDLNTGIPVLGIGIGSFNRYRATPI